MFGFERDKRKIKLKEVKRFNEVKMGNYDVFFQKFLYNNRTYKFKHYKIIWRKFRKKT